MQTLHCKNDAKVVNGAFPFGRSANDYFSMLLLKLVTVSIHNIILTMEANRKQICLMVAKFNMFFLSF